MNLYSSVATAQDTAGFDAHGLVLAPQDGDVRDPFVLPRAGGFTAGEFWVSGAYEYASAPLRFRQNFPANDLVNAREGQTVTVLDQLSVFNVNAGWAPLDFLRLSIAAPLYLGASAIEVGQLATLNAQKIGGSLGDTQLAATFKVVDSSENGFGLIVRPFVTLPFGKQAYFLGDGGVGGGLHVSATQEVDALTFSAATGLRFRPSFQDFGNYPGGGSLFGALAVGYSPSPTLGVNAELVASPALSGARPVGGSDVSWTAVPAELTLGVRGRIDSGLHWAVGGAKGVSPGVGAANFRVFAQVGFSRIHGVKGDRDRDGLLDSDDACPKEAEVFNHYQDADGCPDAGGRILVQAYLDGEVREYVSVVLRDETGVILGQTETSLPDPMSVEVPAGLIQVRAQTPGYQAVQEVEVVADDYLVELKLTPIKRVSLTVVVTMNDGSPVQSGGVSILGDGAPDAAIRMDDGAGRVQVDVPPGDFLLYIKSNEIGVARRAVTLLPGKDQVVEVVLGGDRVVVLDDRVELNESVYFEVGRAELKPASHSLLDELVASLVEHSEILKLEIQGHTDQTGAESANLLLSQRRAEAVLEYLKQRGIAGERLLAKGYGESRPVASEKTDAGKALNRRVELIITRRLSK